MEAITLEFTYNKLDHSDDGYSRYTRKFQVGVYSTFEEAIKAGNDLLDKLANLGLPSSDRFTKNSAYGLPSRLVTNRFDPVSNLVIFYAKIERYTELDKLDELVPQMIENSDEVRKYKKALDSIQDE